MPIEVYPEFNRRTGMTNLSLASTIQQTIDLLLSNLLEIQ